jgi:hypothetical protein
VPSPFERVNRSARIYDLLSEGAIVAARLGLQDVEAYDDRGWPRPIHHRYIDVARLGPTGAKRPVRHRLSSTWVGFTPTSNWHETGRGA